jgi:hypothetical protein
MEQELLNTNLKKVMVVPAFFVVLYSLGASHIVSEPLSSNEFVGIFLYPLSIGLVRVFAEKFIKSNKHIGYLSVGISGIFTGVSAGYTYLSFYVLYIWQQNSSISYLEPMFVTLGLAATLAGIARNLTLEKLKI